MDLLEFILHIKIAVYLKRNMGKPILGDYIFDVGANKGSMTKLFLKLYKNLITIAFEPLPIFKVKSSQVKSSQLKPQ